MGKSGLSRLRQLLVVVGIAGLTVVLAACGSDGSATASANSAEAEAEHGDDDHGDDDHDDDEHDDDDHDDDDHDDDDHDDDDHDDDDHDDDDHDAGSTSGGLDAHVHGSAELFVGISGADVIIDLISPANNIFGFEYEPTTADDVALVDERTATLTGPGLLTFNEAAECSLVGDAESVFEVDGSHGEIEASWIFSCDAPAELEQLDLRALFAAFPGIEDLDAQWSSDAGQSAAELSSASAILRFG